VQVVVYPLSVIFSSVCPFIIPRSLHIILHPFTYIYRPVRPFVFSLTTFFSVDELTFILCSSWPSFDSVSVLHILFPATMIYHSRAAC
jgi:hypothetical protein